MSGARILLVEDENRIREMIKEYLENEGFVIAEAVDGADGLDKFKSLEFDMIASQGGRLECMQRSQKDFLNTYINADSQRGRIR